MRVNLKPVFWLFFLFITSFSCLKSKAQTLKPAPPFSKEYLRLLKLQTQPRPDKKDGKYGYILPQSKKVVIPYIYKLASKFYNGIAVVSNDTGTGIINENGEIKIPLVYSKIIGTYYGKNLIAEKGLNRWGVIDSNNTVLIPFEYEELQHLLKENFAAKRNGKLGVVTSSNKIILPFEYIGIRQVYDSIIELRCDIKDGHLGFFFQRSNIKLDCLFNFNPDFNFNSAIIKSDNGVGIINNEGHFLFPITPNISFYDGTLVTSGHKFHLLDEKYKIIDDIEFDSILPFQEGQYAVMKNNKWGVLNRENKFQIPLKFDAIKGIFHGRTAVKINDKWGFLDSVGNMVIPAIYQEVDEFCPPKMHAVVKLNNKWGIIDKMGKIVTPIEYDYINSAYHCSFYSVMKNGLYGCLNLDGKEAFLCSEKDFDFPLAKLRPIQQNDKWGYSNTNNEIIIPCIYDQLGTYNKVGTRIKYKGKWGYVNGIFCNLINYSFDEAEDFKTIDSHEYAKVKKDGETYFVDIYGNKFR